MLAVCTGFTTGSVRLLSMMLIPAQAAHHNEMMSPAVTE